MAVPTNLTEALTLLTATSSDRISPLDVREVATWLKGVDDTKLTTADAGLTTIVVHTVNGVLTANALNVLTGAVTAMTFPAASTWAGKGIVVAKDNIVGNVTLTRAGADTIAGATVYTLAGTYGTASFIASASTTKIYPFPPEAA